MRARLLAVVLVLTGLVGVGLGVLSAAGLSGVYQRAFYAERVADTTYFASLVEQPLTAGETETLQGALDRYLDVYRGEVHVYRTGAARFAVPAGVGELDAVGAAQLAEALAGARPRQVQSLWPWGDDRFVVAAPVLGDGEVRGAVVTVSPTDRLHEQQLTAWALIAAAVLVALGLGVVVALPVVRWMLRPVQRLDEGTGRVAAAVLAGRAAEPVADGTGPPELRRLTASFDRMADTVTQALSAQRAFVADASHQLRNPLTALQLRLSNLHGHVDEQAAEHHLAALEETERLATLLDGLLALARAERTAPLVPVDVDSAVADRLDAWRPLAEHTGLRLVRAGTDGLTASAPAGAIETVLDAVLDNAVKFTPAGGAVTVETSGLDGHVEVAVRDTGPGLEVDEMERATDRFWRSPTRSNVEGSGLGLAIAARTVELAGGALHLERPPGGGLRVVARLLRAGAPPSPADGPAGPPVPG